MCSNVKPCVEEKHHSKKETHPNSVTQKVNWRFLLGC